jgi:hypothetical protein
MAEKLVIFAARRTRLNMSYDSAQSVPLRGSDKIGFDLDMHDVAVTEKNASWFFNGPSGKTPEEI